MPPYVYKENVKSERLWSILLPIYCCCLIISNVLAAKVAILGNYTLPCGVIIFPVVYILNDMMAELFPLKKVRRGIIMAFLLNLLAVACFELAIILPGFEGDAFGSVLGNSWRVLIASFIAYLVGSNMNALIMTAMHKRSGEKGLFFRCMASTIIGEFLDAIIFIGIAFYGTLPNNVLLTMIGTQAIFKILYELVIFPVTRSVIKSVKASMA